MPWTAADVLNVLDMCCNAYTFPMLDNGYVYPAATRCSLFRTAADWALVIEVFGYSPREGIPSIAIYTFASRLRDRRCRADFTSDDGYSAYLTNNPNNELRFSYPIAPGDWESEDCDVVSERATAIVLRGRPLPMPAVSEYQRCGIALHEPPSVHVFELCRYLAHVAREAVLATPEERRVSVPGDLAQILQLEEWNHPKVVEETERPSGSPTFQQLARVLETGDTGLYQPLLPPNTHWSHWPNGGLL